MILPVILCGGSGSRLWPLSRKELPKQFLSLFESTTLFQDAVNRAQLVSQLSPGVNQISLVANYQHRFLILDQLKEINDLNLTLLLEPVAKNTAPAFSLAAIQATQFGDDPIMVAMPADHFIADKAIFLDAVKSAVTVARHNNDLVILGVKPTRPETGFGYICCGGEKGVFDEYVVSTFSEKPTLNLASKYLSEGNYFWNSGVLVVRASIWLKALKKHQNDIYKLTYAAWQNREKNQLFTYLNKELFDAIPANSIDYAVLEKCPGTEIGVKMICLNSDWSDLGAWQSIRDAQKPDEHNNVIHGDGLLIDTRNTYVHSTTRLVVVSGVDNLAIIETPDAVLAIDINTSQNVKKVMQLLEEKNRVEGFTHRKVYRPWGWYDCIDEERKFKVKRINVSPGASLSLQKHSRRSEHWIVVKGVAEVTCGDRKMTLYENQSTYVPLGEIHRLKNPGDDFLEIIEVQTGDYLGEDDIVRIEDQYGRLPDAT